MADCSSSSFRVLCLTLHAGASGHAVLDGYGVIPGSVFSTRHLLKSTRSPRTALRLLLQRSLRRFRPHCLVLGLTETSARYTRAMREEVEQLARAAELEVVTRWVREGRLLLAGRLRLGAVRLARLLVEGFAPELQSAADSLRRNVWYRRPAWDALALALAELTHRHPRVAAALARAEGHRLPSFRRALMQRDRELHPSSV